jgi:hypothetical protein
MAALSVAVVAVAALAAEALASALGGDVEEPEEPADPPPPQPAWIAIVRDGVSPPCATERGAMLRGAALEYDAMRHAYVWGPASAPQRKAYQLCMWRLMFVHWSEADERQAWIEEHIDAVLACFAAEGVTGIANTPIADVRRVDMSIPPPEPEANAFAEWWWVMKHEIKTTVDG